LKRIFASTVNHTFSNQSPDATLFLPLKKTKATRFVVM